MESLDAKINRYFEKYNVNSNDPSSQEYFSGAVKIALNEYGIPILEIATKFQVADSTIGRWANGIAVPHPLFRQEVLRWIAEKI